jgi:hypothetical protein
MANDLPSTSGQFYDRILVDLTFYIAITAHNPLLRFDPLLAALKEYEKLPGHKSIDLYIDAEHSADVLELKKLVSSHFPALEVFYSVAPPEYTDYSLTWAHKKQLKRFVRQKTFTYYIYAENDMLFSVENFNYWLKYKEILKPWNLEPGFCRYEVYQDQKIPFDNYRRWNLTGPTPNVWGDRPYQASTYLYLGDPELLGFVSLGNPYAGLMILDQKDAERYITSDSCDPQKSYALTGHRHWPIADRSSMGLAFENLRPEQEHRRVVPFCFKDGRPVIASCGLVEHKDTKYSRELSSTSDSLLTVDTMLSV